MSLSRTQLFEELKTQINLLVHQLNTQHRGTVYKLEQYYEIKKKILQTTEPISVTLVPDSINLHTSLENISNAVNTALLNNTIYVFVNVENICADLSLAQIQLKLTEHQIHTLKTIGKILDALD